MDAKMMAQLIKPPVVMLPRFTWVPFIGAWLGRVLPARKYTGRVLSYMEFLPFQQEMSRAQGVKCQVCQEALRRAPTPPEGIDGPEWFGCSCDGAPAPVPAITEEEWAGVCHGFVKAQGFPVKLVLKLPGSVLLEVLEGLFLCQTGANLPRKMTENLAQTNGNDSQPRDSARQRSGMSLKPSGSTQP